MANTYKWFDVIHQYRARVHSGLSWEELWAGIKSVVPPYWSPLYKAISEAHIRPEHSRKVGPRREAGIRWLLQKVREVQFH